MKANFALILDQDGIVLLSRAKSDWRVVGQAHPASPQLAEEMAYLRKTAMELSGGRFSTKLIIPNSQILYTTVSIAVMPDDEKTAIREALEGLTPYATDELSFDWVSEDSGKYSVAAVADLTLSEAEAFADEHRFNPLCFAAIPEPGDFPNEPFFGPTGKARQLLNPGGFVEPDIDPIDIVAVLAALEKEAAAASASDSALAAPDTAPVPLVARVEDEDVEDEALIEEIEPEDAAIEEVEEPAPFVLEAALDSASDEEDFDAEDDGLDEEGAELQTLDLDDAEDDETDEGVDAAPEPELADVEPEDAADDAEDVILLQSVAEPEDIGEEAEQAPEEEDQASASEPEAEAPETTAPEEDLPEESVLASEESDDTEAEEPEEAKTEDEPDVTEEDVAPIAFSSTRSKLPEDEPPAKDTELSGIAARFSPRAEPVAEPPAPEPEETPEPDTVEPAEAEADQEPEADPVFTLTDAVVTPPPAPPEPPAPTVAQRMAALRAGAPQASEQMPFVAPPTRQIEPKAGTFGRFGLLLVLGFLAALGLASAAAYMLIGDPSNPLDGSGLSEAVPGELPSPTVVTEDQLGTGSPQIAADDRPTTPDATASNEQIAAFDPLKDTDLSPDLQALYGIDAPEVTLSGIRQLAPVSPVVPSSERIDDLYTPSIDREIVSHDAVALNAMAPETLDPSIGRQVPPPEFGQAFALDSEGLVVPTPEGTLSPDGILVFAGAPAIRALPRPFAEVVVAPDGLTDARRAELAGILPVPRPGTIAEDTERAQLSGLSRSELAGFRPVPRPAAVVALAEALANAPELVDEPTALAVTASLLPVARPSGLAEKAREVAVQAVRPPPPPAGATVSQAATIQNGIRLNQVNLIGVYGSSSNRRALVRMSGGRFVMVTVGDRIDGGRVSAIGSDSLVYAKGGRNVTLEVPNG